MGIIRWGGRLLLLAGAVALWVAGFDVIFSSANGDPDPMLLEINYFFGRKGLGGSENYYRILLEEIRNWLIRRNLVE